MKYNFDNNISILVKKSTNLFRQLASKLHNNAVASAYVPFLIQLWQKDGQTQSILHKKIGIEQPTAVRTLDRMERDGLIYREKSPQDRRKILIYLTDKSRGLETLIATVSETINVAAKTGFSDNELEQLRTLLKKIITNLENKLSQ